MRSRTAPAPTAVLLIVSALAVFAAPASAQYANVRSGLWAGIGLGGAATSLSCAICRDDSFTGLSGYLRAGGTVTPQLLVGAELSAWLSDENGLDRRVTTIMATATVYPQPSGAFFLKGGVGQLRFKATEPEEDDTAETSTFGVHIGAGYEFRFSPMTSMTPYVNVIATSFGTLESGGNSLANGVNVTLVQFGVGITTH